jgi:hypothetical protein
MAECQTWHWAAGLKITFSVQYLYREAEPVLSPDIADDDIDVFWFSRTKVFLRFGLCFPLGSLVIVRPDLPLACQLSNKRNTV